MNSVDKLPFKNHRLRTLYFGGGTPSLMPIDVIEAILREIKM